MIEMMDALPPVAYFMMGFIWGILLCVLVSALHGWRRRKAMKS